MRGLFEVAKLGCTISIRPHTHACAERFITDTFMQHVLRFVFIFLHSDRASICM
jgi:hypothetical protein